jgi:O-antigen/teichoic acid export membrane protein
MKQVKADNGPQFRPVAGLSGRVFNSMVWLLLQTLGNRAVGILSQLLLAWIMEPKVFGVISTVYAVTTIANAITDLGVDDVLLQRRRSFFFWAVSAQALQTSLSLLALLIAIGGGFAMSLHMREPDLTFLCLLVGINAPIASLQILPTVVMRRDLEFKSITSLNFAEHVAVQLSTIMLALLGFGAYSFVLANPIMSCGKTIILWCIVRPAFRSSRKIYAANLRRVVLIFKNGFMIFQTRLCINVVSQGDYLILGLFANTTEVGYYFFAYKLAVQPLWLIAGNISNVMYPTLVALQKEPARQMSAALRAATLLSYAAFPICFLQCVVCDSALRILFGSKWAGSIPILQILSFGAAFDAVGWIAGSFLNANRQYLRILKITATFTAIFFALVILGADRGQGLGTALSVSLYYILIGAFMANEVFGTKTFDVGTLFKLVYKPALLALIALALSFLSSFWLSDWGRVISVPAVFMASYTLLVWTFERDLVLEVASRLAKGRLGRILASVRKVSGGRLGRFTGLS